MATLDDLPDDQRAVIALVLKQGQSYEGIADLLDLEADTIRSRAHAAVDALGPERGRRLAAGRRAEVADFLLGQQDADEDEDTREYLARSAAARAWARVIVGELRPMGADRLPELPGGGSATRTASAEDDDEPRRGARRARSRAAEKNGEAEEPARGKSRAAARRRSRTGGAAPVEEPDLEPDRDDEEPDAEPGAVRAGATRPSSRLGGAILIGGLALVVAGLVAWLVLKDNGDDGKGSSSTQATSAPTSTQAQPTPKAIAQVNLKGAGKSLAVAQILRSGTQTAIALVGQNIPPSTTKDAYAVWLYSSPTKAKRLGYAPPVTKSGRLQGVAPLPADAPTYKEVVVTREPAAGQAASSKRPGQIVLRGPLKLPAG